MKNVTVFSILLTGASLLTGSVYAQTPDLGAAADFALFTGNGAFTNTLESVVTGDVGTNVGAFEAFPPGILVGERHVVDAVSALASTAVTDAYNSLTATTCETPLGTTLVNEALGAGIYCNGGAVSLDGNLTLDGEGDPDAVFIIKIGGLFSMGDASAILLTGGASYENVFFQVDGAFNMAGGAVFRGTMIAHDAISLLNGASIIGRGLSVAGAISISNNIVTLPSASLPVTLASFDVNKGEGATALLSWTTTSETQSDRFEIEHSVNGKSWEKLGTVAARGESSGLSVYSFTDEISHQGLNLYHLKMIDKDASFSYSPIRSIVFEQDEQLSSYPNPAVSRLTLRAPDMSRIEHIQLNDLMGKRVYSRQRAASEKLSAEIDVTFLPAGVYIMRVTDSGGNAGTLRVLKQ